MTYHATAALKEVFLHGPEWLRYWARVDLFNESDEDPGVKSDRQAMLASSLVQGLVNELIKWPGNVLNSHKSAGHLLHKLAFLAELGYTMRDPGSAQITDAILAKPSPEGPLQVLMNIPTQFGGSGKDEWQWALCDAPLLHYALVKMGLGEEPAVHRGIEYMTGLVRNNGWPCAAGAGLGKFHGPGNKNDPCPYANLIMLQLLALNANWRDSPACHYGVESQLALWEQRRDKHPYIFHMGNDFCKLKMPFVWYDILHVVEVLSKFPWARKDDRLLDMASQMAAKADDQDMYKAESIWTAWKDWDFAQKRSPSPGLTFFTLRALSRLDN